MCSETEHARSNDGVDCAGHTQGKRGKTSELEGFKRTRNLLRPRTGASGKRGVDILRSGL
jgi:hypothetical protein